MFQRLTSLFFSTPPPPEDPDCPQAFVSEEGEVDGWLIIDLPGEACVGGQDSDSDSGSWACEGQVTEQQMGRELLGDWGPPSGLLGKRGLRQ